MVKVPSYFASKIDMSHRLLSIFLEIYSLTSLGFSTGRVAGVGRHKRLARPLISFFFHFHAAFGKNDAKKER